MRQNVQQLSDEPIHWFALSRPAGTVPFDAVHVSKEYMSPPARGNVRLRLDGFWRWFQRRYWAPYAARRIVRRIETLQPRIIWLMADFGLAPVGLRLLPFLRNRRVHVSIHDHLEASAVRYKSSRQFVAELRAFQQGLKALRPSADAVSEELLAETLPEATRKAVVTMAVEPGACAAQLRGPSSQGPLRVGLSGNFFGEEELDCFLSGLRKWSSSTGRDWQLLVFGNPRISCLDPRIEAYAFTPLEKVREALSRCDLLLLPLPIDDESAQMRTSIPTKLVTYLEVGRLIFALAPAVSVTRRLIEGERIGAVVTRLDPAMVVEKLEALLGWDLNLAHTGRQHLIKGRFDGHRILHDLKGALAT